MRQKHMVLLFAALVGGAILGTIAQHEARVLGLTMGELAIAGLVVGAFARRALAR